jgi:diguanylate cyclase (GGDEF)-like protein
MSRFVEIDMRRQRLSKPVLLIVTFCLVALFFAVPSTLLYRRIERLAVENLGQSAMRYAQTVARLIEQDIENYRDLYDAALDTDPVIDQAYYQTMLSVFATIVDDLDATFVYTTRIVDDTSFVYILDGADPNSEVFSPYGSLDEATPTEWRVATTGVPEYTGLLTFERWGTFLSGYAPIVDPSNGAILGIVGVDYSLTHVNQLLTTVLWTIVLGVILLVVFATGVLHRLLESRFAALEIDFLTGLSSKQSYETFVRHATVDALKNHKPLSMLMIDVDDFKQINDIYGHDFGDLVLKQVGEMLKQFRQRHESIARYGGDEFVYVIPQSTIEIATAKAEAILKAARAIDLRPDDKPLVLTLSIGVANIQHLEEPDKLMIAADRAMYLSKSKGKNCVSVYSD